MVEEDRWMISFDFRVISFEGWVTRALTRNVNNGKPGIATCPVVYILSSLCQNCDTIVLDSRDASYLKRKTQLDKN